ncbi:hypothetical protein WAH83_23015, partial [Acinetobacter baumannii]
MKYQVLGNTGVRVSSVALGNSNACIDNVKYQILGNTGVRVSSVALGTANFGMRWGYGASLDESRAILDAFAEDGGNFIDT